VRTGRTTISCRFIAQPIFTIPAAVLTLLAGIAVPPFAPAFGQQPAPRSQFLPLAVRWSVDLSAPSAAAPVVSGNLLVVPMQGGAVVAFRMDTGREAWKAAVVTERPIAADSEHVYVATREAIQALRLDTGETAWTAETGVLTAPFLAHAGWIVAPAAGSVAALRASDGTVVWRRGIGAVEHRPAVDGDMLFVPLTEGRVAGLDVKTGETRWETRLGGAPGEPLAIGGKVYVSATDKRFYTLEASDGETEWTRWIGASPRGRAAVDDVHIYVVALDNILRAFDRGHGAQQWTVGLKYRPAEGPLLITGAIVVPGAVKSMPVLARDKATLTALNFPAPMIAHSNVTMTPDNLPVLGLVTGDLENPWKLWLLEASTAPPDLPVTDLKALPGDVIAIALPG
jgi:outer membrane protein assembly factor BamB